MLAEKFLVFKKGEYALDIAENNHDDSGHNSNFPFEEDMSKNVVNIDALIPREDFEIDEKAANLTTISGIAIRDLEAGFLLNSIRKPDFQRETSDWSPDKILDLIRTFIDGDLVPAVILWHAGGKVFVIDGAHRLSALIAWVHNDYGDGEKSKLFFENNIPPEQIAVAERTRKKIHSEIGAYSEYAAAARNIGSADERIKARLGKMGIVAIPVQWIPATTAKQAEDSFFKINQAATPINVTELRILISRTSAPALAARAIVRSGTGHRYWKHFPDGTIHTEIEHIGKEIYNALYSPPLDTPIKTLDLPVAGRGYGTLSFVFDLVILSNKVKIPDSTKKKNITENKLKADSDGRQTIAYLHKVKEKIARITGNQSTSIGPHPAVYFYTLGGTFQPTAFLATMELFEQLDSEHRLPIFLKYRHDFEEFLLAHKNFVSQIVHQHGSGYRNLHRIQLLYSRVLDLLTENKSDSEMVKALQDDDNFKFLTISGGIETPTSEKKAFSRGMKTAAFMKPALEAAIRCTICGARVHRNSMNVDHKELVRSGGPSTLENAQITHPYCNSLKQG